jgi:outer membrane lipopolysaccharide assembly protein LptE/RlpB
MVRVMTKRLASLLLVLAAGSLAGCGSALVGTWKSDPMPKDDKFAIQQVTFKSDNTYTASAKEGDQNVRLAGTYEFNGFNLKLKTPAKPERTYGAMVVMGRTLELKRDGQKITMKKQ